MLLAEYLQKGGQLPASFGLIQGFEDLFVARYCDHEIGFETDELFRIKLEYKATLVMQAYADKIATRAFYWTRAENPVKAYYEKTQIKTNLGARQRTANETTNIGERVKESSDTTSYGAKSGTDATSIGAQENKTTELPFDATSAEPNTINNLGARSDSVTKTENAHEDSVSHSETEDASVDTLARSENESAVENNDLRETWKEDNGETIDELIRMLEFLNEDVTTLVEKCLNEFKPLFMAVY